MAAVALPAQSFTTLVSFDFDIDGANPIAGLVQGINGQFYGTTSGGQGNGYGTVFTITATGTLTTLYFFCSKPNCTDGYEPYAGLIQATDGNFYGTTAGGGINGLGTVFKITPSGTLTTLHSFDGTDGTSPYGTLVQGANGKFYGTTVYGGANGDGTVFKITPGGTLTILHSFDLTDGGYPTAGLIQASNGQLYGTTYSVGPTVSGRFSASP
jgi:uncharacterized repeat protein (TIGR03803 family)